MSFVIFPPPPSHTRPIVHIEKYVWLARLERLYHQVRLSTNSTSDNDEMNDDEDITISSNAILYTILIPMASI